MRLTVLAKDSLDFPDPSLALPDGLLALGGDLRPERVLTAYRMGIFPWFSADEPPLWWCPDPRCVLYPEKLRISHSMKPLLRKKAFEFRIDSAFEQVVKQCRQTDRPDQDGTWITDEVEAGYTALHQMGYAHSAEAWNEDQLVGGLYGVQLGNVFFGESMFSQVANSSKYAFICWVQHLQSQGVRLIDCQVPTEHLMSLGAELIPREQFLTEIGFRNRT
ncbi:MAG: leucyl/phenylalanyl-tRNA--protein transferase [Sphingobacteriales bacterium]|nr:MAG: leucyl/phenylalanyl-tRNA--protein transferase [Sphingobacteriales bacterium]